MKILKFSASWCMPCKDISKTIKTLPEELQSAFEEVDVDACDKSLLKKYSIRSVPTLVVMTDEGVVIRQITGSQSKEKLLSLFDPVL